MNTQPYELICPAAALADGRLYFRLLSADKRCLAPGAGECAQAAASHRLILIEEGAATLALEDRTRRLPARGAAALIPPGSGFELRSASEGRTAWSCLAFAAAIGTDERVATYSHAVDLAFLAQTDTQALPDRTLRQLRRLERETDPAWRQLRFQELMLMLFAGGDSRKDADAAARVEAAISAMKQDYAEPLTVRDLAAAAKLPLHRFAAIFRQLTGSRPLDYLNELRIERAKDKLLRSAEPLREIARLTGFKDEYYFSRRFRQKTGLAPRQYARSAGSCIRVTDALGRRVDIPLRPQRIVYQGETFGDLVALGAKPVGGSVFWDQRAVLAEHVGLVEDVGWPVDPDALARLGPDLIIMACDEEDPCVSASRIAPTVAFDTFAQLDSRLLKLGELLGRQAEAERWLESHRERTEAMWQQLAGELGEEETAAVFTIARGGRLFVMGTIGLAATLYHASGFRAPTAVDRLLSHRQSYLEIAPEQLRAYAGDRIFLVVTDEPASHAAARALASAETWRSLPAVRQGRAYQVGAVGWNYGDALTSSMLLDKLPALLRRSS
ncbi:helix-turn-helix domain-containing protein [Cohnella sp. 56]|uniref:helix-turn-helix domain-containing protein n=1 Tax=Cohnella sp. 56 TaxID=3113722 RepID=UPI0030E778A8